MLSKRTFWTLLITGMIVISTTVTQAQSTGRRSWARGNGNNPVSPVSEPAERALETTDQEAQEQCSLRDLHEQQKTAIVGSWLGLSSEGNRILQSFTSDGVVLADVQGGVSTDPMLGVLTPAHGVWKHLGGRQFAVTAISVNYDINTGAYLGYLKARLVLTINEAGDQLTGTDKVEIFDSAGNVVFTATGNTTFTRIKFEPFN
jgi:hypothetical protein